MDVVIHLAAIFNGPIGTRYEVVTLDLNYRSSIRIAEMAKDAGAKTFFLHPVVVCHQPLYALEQAIEELRDGLTAMNFKDVDFRNSLFIRLKVLTNLQGVKYINGELEWTHKQRKLTKKKSHYKLHNISI